MFRNHLGDVGLRKGRPVAPSLEALESRMLLSAPAALVSKSVANHAVFMDGASFTQTFRLRNTGTATWNGYYLVHVNGSDALGGNNAPVAVPTASPGATVSVSIPLRAIKSVSNGAAQLAGWELRMGPTASSTRLDIDGMEPNNKSRLWTSVTITSNVYGPGIPRLNHAGYTSTANPFVAANYGGQCTAFVWGRAHELLGLNLAISRSAGQHWINALTGTGKPYKLSSVPKANSIAVWSGHVAYVEWVTGSGTDTKVTISEANWNSFRSYASLNDPSGNEWGGGYDGSPKTLTKTQLESRTGQTFLGYILLQ